MKRNILLVSSCQEVVEPLQRIAEQEKTFILWNQNLLSGMDMILNGVVDAIILELDHNAPRLQDLIFAMENLEHMPAILLFERQSGGGLLYSVSAEELIPLTEELIALFLRAEEERGFKCRRGFFRPAPYAGQNPDDYARDRGREEALREIVRGCSPGELSVYQRLFRLDLKRRGYYLFFRELQSIEYREHRIYKDVLNHIGESMLQECREAIARENGGEVFYFNMTLVCVVINDLNIKSEREYSARLDALLRRLVAITGSRKATMYVSQRCRDIFSLREAYGRYISERGYAFFCGGRRLLRAAELRGAKKQPDLEAIQQSLKRIDNFFRYDQFNPGLDEELRRLFLEIIKPSMDFTAYYYCVSVISSYLAGSHLEESWNIVSDSTSPALLQFSSVEQQLDTILGIINQIRENPLYRRKSKSRFIAEAVDYIETHYQENITIDDISGALFISGTYLSQSFKSMMGTSVMQYLISYRVERAKKLLEETDHMIYYVAEKVGFRDVRHFSKTFKKCTGYTPMEYRGGHKRKA